MKKKYAILMIIFHLLAISALAQNRSYNKIADFEILDSYFKSQDEDTLMYIKNGAYTPNRTEDDSYLMKYSISDGQKHIVTSARELAGKPEPEDVYAIKEYWIIEDNLYLVWIGKRETVDCPLENKKAYAWNTSLVLYNPEEKPVKGFEILSRAYSLKQLPSDRWIFICDEAGKGDDRMFSIVNLKTGESREVRMPDYLKFGNINLNWLFWGRTETELLCQESLQYANHQVVFYNLETGKNVFRFILPPKLLYLVLSPNGRYLATYVSGKGLIFYDFEKRSYLPETAFRYDKKAKLRFGGWSPSSRKFFFRKGSTVYSIDADTQ